jgi:hypothetical protein
MAGHGHIDVPTDSIPDQQDRKTKVHSATSFDHFVGAND